jgi:hypothetical protein
MSKSVLSAILALLLFTGCTLPVDNRQNEVSDQTELIILLETFETAELALNGNHEVELNDPWHVDITRSFLMQAEPVDDLPEREWDRSRTSLKLTLADGHQVTFPYQYCDLHTEDYAYIKYREQWHQVPGAVTDLFESVVRYPVIAEPIPEEDRLLLAEYGWTPFLYINRFEMQLPAALVHEAGSFPSVLYWAYHHELNQDIGLDLTSHLGRTVTVDLYKTAERLPEFMNPRRTSGRAVMVKYRGELIGAWLDAGRHNAFACSLKGNTMEELTGKDWAEWIVAFIDQEHPLEQELAAMDPESVILAYYRALGHQNLHQAYATYTRNHLTTFLFANMSDDVLYNPDFESAFMGGGLDNVRSAEVIEIERRDDPGEQAMPQKQQYMVTLDMEFFIETSQQSGNQVRFVTLIEETPGTGWRIDGIGTGP